ncbi:DEAD/DEAH box helicase [Bradyrhizobium sp. SZCCHNR2034]|uniref:DEAD/DEAH box helicase n=1 Tax=Bradyrhizobium sp. SZCCHNR2034 TaxID=3057385 RepID=UPI00291701A4|nr:DEAD/DEAH box helicase [Bradyrhizobium sp. SZCCHNR2034]
MSDWADEVGPSRVAARVLMAAVDGGDARASEKSVLLSHQYVATLPSSIADHLNMPALSLLSVTLTFDGRVDTPDGSIRARWFDEGTRPVSAKRVGAFVEVGDRTWRLSSYVFELLEAIDGFNDSAGCDIETRITKWQPVQVALREVTGSEVKADGFLGSLTIYQAGSFALDARETANGPDLVPVLMGRHKAPSLEDNAPVQDDGDVEPLGSELRDDTADALLPPELQKRFADERFGPSDRTRDAYVLARNTYVVIDPDLKVALDVVGKMRRASPEDRRNFLRNPRPAIAMALGRDDADRAALGLFVETKQYSERVVGLGIWDPPKLPWLQKKAGQWAPETFPVTLRGRTIELTPERLDDIIEQVDAAKREERLDVAIDQETYTVAEVEAAVGGLRSRTKEPSSDLSREPGVDEDRPAVDENVLILKQNIDGVEYQFTHPRRPVAISRELPIASLAQTRPKPHQTEGFKWLVDAWEAGWPGVLLADDMGLGKTFQALAFMAWIRSNMAAKSRGPLGAPARGPILIVAPTALLRNWAAEAELHLASDVLGDRVDVFGPGLKELKRAKAADWTPEDALDVDRLRDADWILTTYETLADNHRAFARVPCSIVIFDEMQKVKSPGTINTHAAKALNADFVLGLTGTPIENRLEDLWCIMDRVAPGYLGDLKTFSATHTEDAPDALKELKAKLDEPRLGLPAIMLRRMKDQILVGLPAKSVKRYRVDMPPAQCEAYAQAVREAQSGDRTPGAMLKVIHALRSISLHPNDGGDIDPYDPEAATKWVRESARVQQVFSILNAIEKNGEKALVFLEHRDVQTTFAAAAATLLGLRSEPVVINGTTPGAKRQDIVDRFQNGPPGFNLLVLSPKAAGVGLTITAANHVIHLSRWWNPAVEDQCNDRVYRIGQSKPVTVHVPMAVHPSLGDRSFDANLDRLLEHKRSLSRHMLAPPVGEADVGVLFNEAIGTSEGGTRL